MRPQRVLATAAGVLVAATALATPMMKLEFDKVAKPPKQSRLATSGCVVCHTKGKELNPYGKDVAAAIKALKIKPKKITPDVLKKIAKLDSDKDKASNEKELKAGTLPGDAKSKP